MEIYLVIGHRMLILYLDTQPSTCSRTSYLSCFIPIYTYPAPHTFATSPTEYRDTYKAKESISAEPQEQVLLGKQDSLPPVQMLR